MDSWESWFNPVAWNAAVVNSTEGSNPSLSTIIKPSALALFFHTE